MVVQKGGKSGDSAVRVGLPDGRIVPLTTWSATIRREPQPLRRRLCQRRRSQDSDAAPARCTAECREAKSRRRPRRRAQAQLRVRPTVQGAALVLENKTGRILAMAGSFSYPLSQLNRTAQTQRQPGSAMKPVTYLTALQHGLQPNTLIPNEPITFPPIGSGIDGRDVISREFGGTRAPGGLLVAAQRRLQRGRRLYAAPRSGEFGQRGHRASARRRHRRQIRKRASTMSAPPRSPRKSTRNVFAIIRSCSAHSRSR